MTTHQASNTPPITQDGRLTQDGPLTQADPQLFVEYLNQQLPQLQAELTRTLEQFSPLDDGVCTVTHDAHTASPTDTATNTNAGATSSITCMLNSTLYQPLIEFTQRGGKRVRPILALLSAELAGVSSRLGLIAGIAIELFQTAALIHDDIADKGDLRRGEPCLQHQLGTGLALNVGDLGLICVEESVLLALESCGDELKSSLGANHVSAQRMLKELLCMQRHTLEGQALDLGWVQKNRWDITPEEYLFMARSKTAWYSAASPLRICLVATQQAPQFIDLLTHFALHAGLAFQIQDDLLNLAGSPEKQGKDFMSDITEGKRTLALCSALATWKKTDKKIYQELLTLAQSHTHDQTKLLRAVELIGKGGGIACCEDALKVELIAAEHALAELQNNQYISATHYELLRSLAAFFIQRTH